MIMMIARPLGRRPLAVAEGVEEEAQALLRNYNILD